MVSASLGTDGIHSNPLSLTALKRPDTGTGVGVTEVTASVTDELAANTASVIGASANIFAVLLCNEHDSASSTAVDTVVVRKTPITSLGCNCLFD